MAKKSSAELQAEADDVSSLILTARKRPLNFALLIAKEGVVLEAHPKKDPTILKRLAKAKGGGAKGAQGIMNVAGKSLELTCIDQDVPGNLVKVAKSHFAKLGLKFKVVLIMPDGSRIEDMEADDDEGGPGEAALAKPKDGANISELVTRVKSAQPLIAAAPQPIAGKLAAALKQVAAFMKAQDSNAAAKLLGKIEATLNKIKEGNNEQTASVGNTEKGLSESVEAALQKMLPQIQGVLKRFPSLKRNIITEISKARNAAKLGATEDAKIALSNLDEILQKAASQKDLASVSVMKLGKARIEWLDVRKDALASTQTLKSNILDAFSTAPEVQKQVNDSLSRLDNAIGQLNDDLHKALDKVLGESDPDKRGELAEIAADVAKTFLNLTTSDPILSVIDGSAFSRGKSIIKPLSGKLSEIISALGKT